MRPSPANVKASIDAGDDASGRHRRRRACPGSRSPRRRCGAVVFAELIGLKRDRGLETSELAWRVARLDPSRRRRWPRAPGPASAPTRLIAPRAGSITRRSASRLPLSHPPGRDARGTALAASIATARCAASWKTSGAWDDDWEPIGPRPADYVRKGELRNADWLIAHGTYLEPDDFWQLRPEAAPEGHRVAIAFCPRTHARFRPCPSPLPRAPGTWRDRLPGDRQPGVERQPEHPRRDSFPAPPRRSLSGELLLTMATLFGAWALRRDHNRQHQARQIRRPGDRLPARPRRSRPLRPAARIRPPRGQHGLRGRFREWTLGWANDPSGLRLAGINNGRVDLGPGSAVDVLAAARGRDRPRPSRKS